MAIDYALLNWLTGHQTTMLLGMGVIILLVRSVYTYQVRIPRSLTWLKVLYVAGWLWGAYCTYAAFYLGWNKAADPMTITLLFIGGAVGMHLERHVPWSWILAPIVAGVGTLQLWDSLIANPQWQITAGSIIILTLPAFLLLTYIERAHQAFGNVFRITGLAALVGLILCIQGVALWGGVSLWHPLAAGLNNVMDKIRVLLGG